MYRTHWQLPRERKPKKDGPKKDAPRDTNTTPLRRTVSRCRNKRDNRRQTLRSLTHEEQDTSQYLVPFLPLFQENKIRNDLISAVQIDSPDPDVT